MDIRFVYATLARTIGCQNCGRTIAPLRDAPTVWSVKVGSKDWAVVGDAPPADEDVSLDAACSSCNASVLLEAPADVMLTTDTCTPSVARVPSIQRHLHAAAAW